MKALILAAGFGTRLRPLTFKAPKPMIPFFGFPFMDYAKFQISNSIKNSDIFINTHYLPQVIEEHVKNSPLYKGVNISHEKDVLGTGGSINPIRAKLEEQGLLIYNADIISNIDIENLIEHHKKSNNLATMVLLKNTDKSKTQLFVKDNYIMQIGGECDSHDKEYSFTGVHIVSSDFIKEIPKSGFQNIIDTYKKLLDTNRIGYVLHDDLWFDVGTPRSLLDGHLSISNSKKMMDKIPLDEISSIYNKPSPLHDYSKVYTRPGRLDSINTGCTNTVIMDYSNSEYTDQLSLKNVLWIDGDLDDTKREDCIVWNDIEVKL